MRHFFPYLGMVALLLLCYWQMFFKAWTKARWESVTGIAELKRKMEVYRFGFEVALRENEQRKFLLRSAAMRSAPKHFSEILGGSNGSTGNACYIHPQTLAKVQNRLPVKADGYVSLPGTQIYYAGSALIIATMLMPENGVIFGPLSKAFYGADYFSLGKEWRLDG